MRSLRTRRTTRSASTCSRRPSRPCRLDRRPRARRPLHARRRRRAPHRDAAQAARGHAPPPGLRRHQHHRHAEPARRGGRRRRRRLRLHEHDQRVRPRADAAAGRAGGLDHRGRAARCPKNIYGATKIAAEDLCELFHRHHGLPCMVLRTSRFFPEHDDRGRCATRYDGREPEGQRVPPSPGRLEDVVEAHLLAIERAAELGFGRYIISATTPFTRDDLATAAHRRARGGGAPRAGVRGRLRARGAGRCSRRSTASTSTTRARTELGWQPRHDFRSALGRVS